MKPSTKFLLSALISGASSIALATATTAADEAAFKIAAGDLRQALTRYIDQSGEQLIYRVDDLRGVRTKGVSGTHEADDALEILLDNTGFKARWDRSGAAVVVKTSLLQKMAGTSTARTGQASKQTPQKANTSARPRDEDTPQARSGLDALSEEELEEIVITGSHIRGVRSASPVFIYGRQDIEQTGVSTVPQFMQTLPQNFGGGISESTAGLVSSGNTNVSTGTGVNLRGLGSDATLVLLNGRRMAPAGFGDFVDISVIPLSAIERVDVLTDGASAIYGSDAVGGVVNFVLRKDYDGAETRVRYGSATSGDLDDIQLGQIFGTTWSSGHALIAYEYQKRDALDANDRAFAIDAADPTDLLSRQERHSVFVTAGQNVTDAIEIFGDGFYSIRESEALSSQGVTLSYTPTTEQYGLSLGARADLNENWQAELAGNFSRSELSSEFLFVSTDDSFDGTARLSKTWSVDSKVDGTVFAVPGGDVKLAVGGQYRHETYQDPISLDLDEARNIYAVFGEVFLPLVGSDNQAVGLERLELTMAGRYESYSSVGSSFDSKFGLLWSPLDGLNFRGTWGTSFRAPLLTELDGTSSASALGLLFFLPDPSSPSGTTLSAIALGNNPDLQPETATSWSAGVDITPASMPSLNIQATYFNIDFSNRIVAANAFFDAFTDPRWEPLLDRNPDPIELGFLASRPFSSNFAPGFSFTDAEVIVNNRLRNVAGVETKGLDITLSYSLDSEMGSVSLSLAGTYLFEQLEQLIETDVPLDIVGTVFNPPDLKLRGNINWRYEDFSINLAINHVGSFHNVKVDPVEAVSSWTTMDLNISYSTGEQHAGYWLDNMVFSLSAINLFDLDPPFVLAPVSNNNINYDPANASPFGRLISIQITKKW
ncbi:MAG: TonB-dependent receptor [Kordiimonadaceae bacterium]|nr:TonB-dependent receptor [Kordiimonadaceae bacterium]